MKDWKFVRTGNAYYPLSKVKATVERALQDNDKTELYNADAILEDARLEREEQKRKIDAEIKELEQLFSKVDSAIRKK